MTKPDFDDNSVRELRGWRRQVAHHVANYDSISGVTLVSQICEVQPTRLKRLPADFQMGVAFFSHG